MATITREFATRPSAPRRLRPSARRRPLGRSAGTFGAPNLIVLAVVVLAASVLGVGVLAPRWSGAVEVATAHSQPSRLSEITCPRIVHQAASVTWSQVAWKVCMPGTVTQSSPAVTTYRGRSLVAVGDELGVVHVLDARTGVPLRGWPKALVAPAGGTTPIESSPVFAYLHGPRHAPDVIVAAGSTWVHSTTGEVEAFTLSGRSLWVFHVGQAAGTAIGVISTPAVGDVLGNGQRQIVFGSWDHHLYVLNANGQQVGFAYDNADTIWSSPALVRLPGQRADSVFIGSDASGRPDAQAPGGHCVGGFVTDFAWSAHAVNPDTNQVGPGLARVWYHCLNQSIWSSPAVGVINATGRLAVVVGTSAEEQPFPSDTNKLFAYYAANGATVPGWPATTTGPALGSPAIGVLDGGNTPSVVETSWVCSARTWASCVSSNRSAISAYTGAGRLEWRTNLPGPTLEGSAVLTPLRGEPGSDVLVGTSYGVYPLSGASGRFLFGTDGSNQWATMNPACRVFSSLAVTAVRTGWDALESCGGPPAFHTPGEIVAFPLPTTPGALPAAASFESGGR